MRKERLVAILAVLIIAAGLSFFVLPKTGFAVHTQALGESGLENLRIQAQVECLQNSQCSENQECIGNICVEKSQIDVCQSTGLSTASRNLKEGDSINSIKSVLTKKDLPHLLSEGELVEITNEKTIEYFYSPVILIGNNKIERNNEIYEISNGESMYTYKLFFSNPVDFSNKNLHGQTLRIFGEEYLIDKNSDNSNVELISKNKNLKLKDANNIKIIRDENGNVIAIEIYFNSLNKIKIDEDYRESLFNKTKISFDNINSEFADIKIGGVC